MSIKIPDEINQTVYIQLGVGKYNKNELYFSEDDPGDDINSSSDWATIKIGESELSAEVTIDRKEVVTKLVSALNKEKEEILARHHMEQKEIDDRIQNLLAIEYHGD